MSHGGQPASPWPARLCLALFCVVTSVGAIVARPLTTHDETRVAGIAREMALEGRYAVPRLDGSPFLEYPSLGYLPAAGLLALRGAPSDFLVLLPSAVAALGTLLLTFAMARRIAGERAALVAVLVLQNTVGFVSLFARLLVDPLMVFWVTLSCFGAVEALSRGSGGHARGAALFQLGMAGGFLTKGLVGLALPAAVVGGFLLARRQWRGIPRLLARGAPLLLLAPIALWTWRVWVDGGNALALEVWRQSAARALSSSADHAGPITFYLGRFFYLFAPVSLLLPWLIQDGLRRDALPSAGSEEGSLDRFGLAWLAVGFVGLSLASAKRNLYMGPLYPGFALAVGIWWARQARAERPSGLWRWLADRVPQRLSHQALLLGGLAAVHLGIHAGLRIPDARRRDPTPIFADAQRWERAAPHRQVVLVEPKEAMSGAAVYTLGRLVPQVSRRDWPPSGALAQQDLLLVGRATRVAPLRDAVPPQRRGTETRLRFAGEPYCLCEILAPRGPAEGRRPGS